MDATNVEFSGNNSNINSEVVVSYLTTGLQFIPIVILLLLVVFYSNDLKSDIFENLAIVTCIDAASAITTIYYKHSTNNLTLILVNFFIFALGLVFYMMLVLSAVKVWLGLFYGIIALATLSYVIYKVNFIIKG